MTLPCDNEIPNSVRNAEETLRLLARVPAPEGLVERVQASLRTAPRRSFLMRWTGSGLNGWVYSPALRGMAAAAIVLLVAGGGWQIYSHVQSAPNAQVAMPARVGNGGAFANAGAMRTPDTLHGPVLAHVYDVAGARQNAASLASGPVSVRGHFWRGKEGSILFDSGHTAVLTLQYSDEFNAKYQELLGRARKSDIATITGRLHSEADGRLVLTADDIQFADDSQ